MLTVPPIEEGRALPRCRFIDGYTYNFAYVGSRTTGNGGGKVPAGRAGLERRETGRHHQVIKADTEFAPGVYCTQLFGARTTSITSKKDPGGLPPSLGVPGQLRHPPAALTIDWPAPLTPPTSRRPSLRFFDLLDFIAWPAPTMPSEQDVRAVRLGRADRKGTFDSAKLSPELQQAFHRRNGRRLGAIRRLQEGQTTPAR